MGKSFCQALLLLTFVVAACTIVPARLLRGGVGGSVTAIAVSVVASGVVGTGGRVEAVNILGAVGAVAVACGAIAVHHCCLPLSHFVVLIIAQVQLFVNTFFEKICNFMAVILKYSDTEIQRKQNSNSDPGINTSRKDLVCDGLAEFVSSDAVHVVSLTF
jgi:hypothetical protein